MKMNLTIDTSWLDENGHIDDQVKDAIVKQIVMAMEDKFIGAVQEEATTIFTNKVDALLSNTINKFLDGPITITDSYGNIKDEYAGVNEMLLEKFDAFLTEEVDNSGHPVRGSGYCSSSRAPRIQYLLDSRINDKASRISQSIVDQVEKKLKASLDVALKQRISEKLLKMVDLEDLLRKI